MRRLAAAALGALAAANPPGPDIFKRQRIHDCGAATFRAVAEPRGAFKMRFLCAQRRSRACSWTNLGENSAPTYRPERGTPAQATASCPLGNSSRSGTRRRRIRC
mmetsp:Transcript_32898/g.99082  ORF Transcript_32898/g.99082 Transcript_32898/m.99082 type:complete len:105 (-) Transcript_32898:1277-1591(-)